MKFVCITLLALSGMAACSNNESKKWSDEDRTSFVRNCMSTAINQFQNDSAVASTYCTCMLEKVEAKFKSDDEANEKMTIKEANEMAKECLP